MTEPDGYRYVLGLDTETGDVKPALADEDSVLAAADAIRKARRGGPGSRPQKYSSTYANVFDRGTRKMAESRELSVTDHRILWALLHAAPYTGEDFPSEPEKYGEIAQVSYANTVRAFSHLVSAEILERPRKGRLRFNPQMVWRGGVGSREAALAEKIARGYAPEEEEP